MKVALEHTLRAPVARVFAYMADPANRPRWQGNTQAVEMLSQPPTRVGTRWRETTRGVGTYEAEVVALEVDRLWVEAAEPDGAAGRITVAFRAEDEATTRLSVTVDIRLRGAKRVLGGPLAALIRRQMPEDLARLEALLAEPADR